ncbi:fatty acyl-AMP ligase [Pyxidicoccus sp. 3LFB2]
MPTAIPAVETLTDLLRWRAQRHPDAYAYTFLGDGEKEEQNWTYADIDRHARAIAAQLQEYKASGERALLIYPPGMEHVGAFFGSLYAGVAAVPAYPPQHLQSIPRILSIIQDARPRFALTTTAILDTVKVFQEQHPALGDITWIATDALPAGLAERWRPPTLTGRSLAFLQYTSGSTSTPKGVMVLHRNLLDNEEMLRQSMGMDENSTIVGWLPLYHDMGLIGNVLLSMYVGTRAVLMSPWSFLQRPARWLWAISHYRAVMSGGPNFGYALCVRKVKPEQRATLDLSSWRIAFNGAEPVQADTLARFADAFASVGFRRESLYPCYGLAEATLFVSGGVPLKPYRTLTVDAGAMERDLAVPVAAGTPHSRTLVGCGTSWGAERIRIVDPKTLTARAQGEVGEIWVAGPHVTQGYWGRDAINAEVFQARVQDSGEGPFLRTGDLGLLLEGELYITGRIKDLIIIDGRNHYPQDIEQTVECTHEALRQGCSVAFSIEHQNEEKLVVLAEIDRRFPLKEPTEATRPLDLQQLARKIGSAVAAAHSVDVHEVVLLQQGEIPKTSSGKLQRRECRAKYLKGELRRWQAEPHAAPA